MVGILRREELAPAAGLLAMLSRLKLFVVDRKILELYGKQIVEQDERQRSMNKRTWRRLFRGHIILRREFDTGRRKATS
jgi:hypothetical protein